MASAIAIAGAPACGREPLCGPDGVARAGEAGVIELRTADDVAALAGCTVVEGGLTIGAVLGPAGSLPSPVPRPELEQPLTSLLGLEALERVSGPLTILGNPNGLTALDDLSGLEALAEVGGLLITRHPLRSVRGLSSLTAIGGDLKIAGNPTLGSLEGLEQLERVDGSVFLGGGCDNSFFREAFVACGPGDVSDLGALSNLRSIGGGLTIDGTRLANIDALQGVGALAFVTLERNDALTTVRGLQGLTTVGPVTIAGNAALADLRGLDGITSIEGDLVVAEALLAFSTRVPNAELRSLAGLDNVERVDGNVLIAWNPRLADLSGLGALATVGGNLAVDGAPLPCLVEPCDPGSAHDDLVSLRGLESLRAVGNDLRVEGNPALADISALQTLASVGGALRVRGNPILPDCDVAQLATRLEIACDCGGNDANAPSCSAP